MFFHFFRLTSIVLLWSAAAGSAIKPRLPSSGLNNVLDNCPLVPNVDQVDRDRDRVGDVCDTCPDMVNPNQVTTTTITKTCPLTHSHNPPSHSMQVDAVVVVVFPVISSMYIKVIYQTQLTY